MSTIKGPYTQLDSPRCPPVLAGRHGYNEAYGVILMLRYL